MGFETLQPKVINLVPQNNKAVPMGFETRISNLHLHLPQKIIKQSLWDLKPIQFPLARPVST